MSRPSRRLGILGGTLDPVHYGHLDAAEAARQELTLDEVWFVPSHDPPHRPIDPVATGFHRFAMASLAAAEHPAYRASDIELRRGGPSYTIDTLKELHGLGWQPAQLFFIIGVDAFAEMASWRDYPAVLTAANFVVIARAGAAAAQVASRAPELAGRVVAGAGVPANSADTRVFPVEARTRDVSSSLIRQRLRHNQSIAGLVPAAVERHIMAYGLYGSGRQLA
jgi:nicotinate-nucleotide adenylyltransferase